MDDDMDIDARNDVIDDDMMMDEVCADYYTKSKEYIRDGSQRVCVTRKEQERQDGHLLKVGARNMMGK